MGNCAISKYVFLCDRKQFKKLDSDSAENPTTSRSRLNNFNSNLNCSFISIIQNSLYDEYSKLESRSTTKKLDNFIEEIIPIVRSVLMKEY